MKSLANEFATITRYFFRFLEIKTHFDLQKNHIERQKVEKAEVENKNAEKVPKLELKRPNEPTTYVEEREIICGKMKLVHKVVKVRKSTSTKTSKNTKMNQ